MKKNRNVYCFKKRLLSVFALFFSVIAFAQDISVTGKVFDENDQVLPGVQIYVKGTNIGTITDFDGVFGLTLPEGSELVFNYIGYIDQIVKVSESGNINVKMLLDMQNLEEVVVIGYGTAKKKDLTGSVGSVKVEEMQIAPVASVEQALAGRVSGVQVSSTQGRPGAATEITIRGTGSLTQSSAPLIVVDGFPMDDSFNLSSIDQADIEGMEILKGPSAIGIYGARGGNGVILITTKGGVAGKTEISYNTFYGVNRIANYMEVLSPYDFVDLRYEVDAAAGVPEATTRNYGDLSLYLKPDGTSIGGIDWQKEVFRDTEVASHNISINGGTAETKYNLSVSNYKSDGILVNSGFERTYMKLKFDQKVTKKLRIGTSINYTISEIKGVHTSTNILDPNANNTGSSSGRFNLLKDIVQGRPTGGLFYSNEQLLNAPDDPETEEGAPISNPLINAQTQDRNDLTQSFYMNAFAKYTILNGLDFRIQGGLTKQFRRFESFDQVNSAYHRRNGVTRGSIRNLENTNKLLSTTLTYRKSFGAHKFNLLLGYDYQDRESLDLSVSSADFPEPNLGVDNLGLGTVPGFPRSSRAATNTLSSFFSRLSYNYKGKYLFTGTIRRDGSSRFGENNKYGVFPSVSGAWRFSDESFINNWNVFSDGKLRAEWGQVGNNRIPASVSQSVLSGTTYGENQGVTAAVKPDNLANSGIKWEAQEQINFGLDLGFLNNRILLSTDVYRKQSKDLLLRTPIPASSGFTEVFKNVGQIRTDGLEISLSTVNINKKGFSWNTNFNISMPRTKTIALAVDDVLFSSSNWYGTSLYNNDYISEVGQPFGLMYGYIDDGLYREGDFNETGDPLLPVSFQSNVQPGFRKYKDVNGDDKIDEQDQVVLGNPRPLHFGGFSNDFKYKGFDLNIFFQWSYGNDVYNANRILYTSDLKKVRNFIPEIKNRWRTDRTPEENAGATFRSIDDISPVLTSAYIEDGSYIRLKTVSLGYSLPKNVLKSLKASRLRLYVTGQNLYTWTNYSGFDPESSTRGNGLTAGVDFGAYPRSKTIIMGLSVGF